MLLLARALCHKTVAALLFAVTTFGLLPGTAAAQGSAASGAAGRDAGGGTFVAMSDLHFDPFFDPALMPSLLRADAARWERIFQGSTVTGLGTYGRDTSYPLLASTLDEAARVAPHPDFILIPGDFLGHNFQKRFAQLAPGAGSAALPRFEKQTMRFVVRMIRRRFPRTPLIMAVGNNDADCGDYQVEPRGPLLAELARLWRPLPGARSAAAGRLFRRTFAAGGYYSLPHPTVPHLQVIVLNTVYFSPKFANACARTAAPVSDPGERELEWLERTLAAAARRGDHVWLVDHIPPGIDAFRTLAALQPPAQAQTVPEVQAQTAPKALGTADACAAAPVSFWREDALVSFRAVLARFPRLVTASFSGHTHTDEFRLTDDRGFIRVVPSVSPIFGNNPSFAVYLYAPATGTLTDSQTWALDLNPPAGGEPQWALEYDFRQAYGQPAIDGASLRSLQQAIGSDEAVRRTYMTFYPASAATAAGVLDHWKVFWCGAQASTAADFAACYCPAGPTGPTGPTGTTGTAGPGGPAAPSPPQPPAP